MNHQPGIAGGHDLIDQRPLRRRHKTVLDQLFIADRLFEPACFYLEPIDVMNVQVRILYAGLPLAEVGQQAEFVVFKDRGFNTETGSADQVFARCPQRNGPGGTRPSVCLGNEVGGPSPVAARFD